MRTAARVAALVFAAFLLLSFLDKFLLVELLARRTALPLALAFLNSVAIVGAGFAVRGLRGRVWRVESESRALDLPLDFIIGYPIFGTLCFLVATLYASTWTLMPMTIVCATFGAFAIVRARESGVKSEPIAFTTSDVFPLVAIALVFIAGLLAAQAPPLSLDELAYHLAVPHTWLLEGRAIELPLLSHSYFPLGIESADLPLLAALDSGGGIASHFLHLLAAIAATLLIHRLTKRNLFATAAIVATPALALTAGWSLVDWPLLGITAALVLALDEDDHATIAAAVGAGLLTKYTFIPLALVALVVARRWRPALPGLAIGSVFFIRNLILTGNPVAPFLSPNAPHVSGYRAGAFLSDYVFDGRFLDESLGASLLSLAALTAGQLAWILVMIGGLLFFLAPSSRLLIPFFAIPAARASENLGRSRAMRIILIIAISAQLLLVAFFVDRTGVFELLSGRASDDELVAKQRPSYAAVAWLNKTLPADSRTLLIGLSESYLFTRRVRGGGNFDGPRISKYLAAPLPEALYAQLRRDGITHVAIVTAPPPTKDAKKLEERETVLSPDAQRMLAQTLDRYTANIVPGPNTVLFALR
ncbi:MAG: hypothetical protein QOI24_4633 [Acidobacteriota bacterium]|jgi:hypothetical protein|nr:hypothetical protein [Acidobacteriota bacterium]